MPYCTGKNIEKARGNAMKMLIVEQKSPTVVANHFGVSRSTIWRWRQRWAEQNQHLQLHNPIRRKELGVSAYKYNLCKWNISTISSAPHHPHTLSEDLVQLVLDVKEQLKRCAEVVWHYINQVLGIDISLSSVRRILNRHHQTKAHKRRKRRRYKGIKRPTVLMPGDLVETDVIHLYKPVTGAKRYIYTVIDLYTRMSYARIYHKLKPSIAVNTILEAEAYFGFKFKVVQSDNGAEFSTHFENTLIQHELYNLFLSVHDDSCNSQYN